MTAELSPRTCRGVPKVDQPEPVRTAPANLLQGRDLSTARQRRSAQGDRKAVIPSETKCSRGISRVHGAHRPETVKLPSRTKSASYAGAGQSAATAGEGLHVTVRPSLAANSTIVHCASCIMHCSVIPSEAEGGVEESRRSCVREPVRAVAVNVRYVRMFRFRGWHPSARHGGKKAGHSGGRFRVFLDFFVIFAQPKT